MGDIEHQEAVVKVRVSVPVGDHLTDKQRREKVAALLAEPGDSEDLEIRGTTGLVELTDVETAEEHAERLMAEAEMREERRRQDRLERHWDNRGHY